MSADYPEARLLVLRGRQEILKELFQFIEQRGRDAGDAETNPDELLASWLGLHRWADAAVTEQRNEIALIKGGIVL